MLTRCQRDNPQPEHRTRTWLRLRNASTPLGTGWPARGTRALGFVHRIRRRDIHPSRWGRVAGFFCHGMPHALVRLRLRGNSCAALPAPLLRSDRERDGTRHGSAEPPGRLCVSCAFKSCAEHFTETIKMRRFQRVSQIEVRWFHGGRTCRRSTTSGPDGSPPAPRSRRSAEAGAASEAFPACSHICDRTDNLHLHLAAR